MGPLDPVNTTNPYLTVPGGAVGSYQIYVFCPTARARQQENNSSTRESDQVYWKGYKERLSFYCNSAVTTKWRRFAIDVKSIRIAGSYSETTNGDMNRIFRGITDAALWGILFKGLQGVDWNNFMTAKLDNQRVRVLYDRTRTLRSGNDSAHGHDFSWYLPLEKNFRYDDDESGGLPSVGNYFSAPSRYGLGDVYIFDIFETQTGTAASTTDALQIRCSATAYWHEK